MNRMWVRTSLVIVTVVILMGLSPLLLRRFTTPLPDARRSQQEGFSSPVLPDEFEEERLEIQEQTRQDTQRRLMISLAVGAVVGLVIGILLSRSLTAPLSRLETGAKKIALQNYDHRIPERGTQEVRVVARAFNQMAAELEQAETLRRNMLADITHELRHPVHVLQGNLRAILDEVYPLNIEEIDNLLSQAELLSTLTNDLYELAQAEAHQLPVHFQHIDLNLLVEKVVNVYNPQADLNSIDLTFHRPPAEIWLEADSDRIRQVLSNLLDNALKFTHAGDSITVSLESGETWVSIHIEDSGEGIAPDDLPLVFDRFYQADASRDRTRSGTGIGLAIAKAIVDLHDGEIQAWSAGKGAGTHFTVRLPRRSTHKLD